MRKRSASKTSAWSSATRMHGVRVSLDFIVGSSSAATRLGGHFEGRSYLHAPKAVVTTVALAPVSGFGTGGTRPNGWRAGRDIMVVCPPHFSNRPATPGLTGL